MHALFPHLRALFGPKLGRRIVDPSGGIEQRPRILFLVGLTQREFEHHLLRARHHAGPMLHIVGGREKGIRRLDRGAAILVFFARVAHAGSRWSASRPMRITAADAAGEVPIAFRPTKRLRKGVVLVPHVRR